MATTRLQDRTDEQLVRDAQGGCAASFGVIVERFEGRLFNFLLRRTSSRTDAEDLVQETFVRAWRRLSRYDDRWRFSTWLFTIAARQAASHYRSSRRTVNTAAGAPLEMVHHDPSARLSTGEQTSRVWRLAASILSSDQQTALWLRYVEGMMPADIATVLGKSGVAVRVLLFRARESLASRLREEDAAAGLAPRGESAGLPAEVWPAPGAMEGAR